MATVTMSWCIGVVDCHVRDPIDRSLRLRLPEISRDSLAASHSVSSITEQADGG